MPFVNERLTQEEKAYFEAKAIPNPGNPFFSLQPSQWTINREENVFLVWCLQNREEPDEYYFLLNWKGTPLTVKLKQLWENGTPRTWNLLSMRITEELLGSKSEILNSLKDALVTYGYNGNPNEPFDAINKHVKVMCNF